MANIPYFVRLILFLIKFGAFRVTGELTIFSSPSYAIEDRSFTISCLSNTPVSTAIIWESSNGFSFNVTSETCPQTVDNYQVKCSEQLQNVSLTFPRNEIFSLHNSTWECTEENSSNSASYIVNVNVPVKSVFISMNGSDINNNALWIHSSYLITFACTTSPSRPRAEVYMRIQNVSVSAQQQVQQNSTYSQLYTTLIEYSKVPGREKTLTINCFASNTDGNVNRAISINIIYPPSKPVINLSSPFPWNSGSNTSLSCDSDPGNPPNTTYKWLENNFFLAGETENTINLSLTPEFNDRKYSCYSTNGEAQSEKSTETKLIVYYAPGKPRISTTHFFSWKEGQNKSLTCLSNPGNPMQTYQWRKNGNVVASGAFSTLWLGRLSRYDNGGNYSCRVYNRFTQENNWNNLTSPTLMILVNYAPSVTVETPNHMREGDTNVQFRCVADGNPDRYSFKLWEHFVGSQVVRTFPGNATIFFGNMSYEDSGIYKCSAENGVTDPSNVLIQTGSRNVTVNAKPVIYAGQTLFICRENRSLVVPIAFYSVPSWNTAMIVHNNISKILAPYKSRLSVVFHKKSVSVEAYSASYRISRCTKADNGTHTLRIGNSLGRTEKEITIKYSGKPEPPYSFQSVLSGTTSLKLSWSAGFDGGHTQTFIVTYISEKNSTEKEVETLLIAIDIENLQPDLAYVFWLQSRNSKGLTQKSPPLIARTISSSQDSQSLNPGSIGLLAFGLLLTVAAICVLVWNFRQKLQVLIERLRSDERKEDTQSQRVYVNTSFSQESASTEHDYINVTGAKGNVVETADDKHDNQILYEALTPGHEQPYESLKVEHETRKQKNRRKNANKPLTSKENTDQKDIYQNVGKTKALARRIEGVIDFSGVIK